MCNHPLLVVNKDHPLYDAVIKSLNKDNTTLHDITHSAKLLALKYVHHIPAVSIPALPLFFTDSYSMSVALVLMMLTH